MAVETTRLGPGTLTLTAPGATPTPLDVSCQLANAVVAASKDEDDPITVLCGDTAAGAVRYTYTLGGTFLQDLAKATGVVAFSWANKGVACDFAFEPSTTAGASVTGSITVDPLDIGSTEDYGAVMQSDFEWSVVGEPVVAFGTGAAAELAGAAV